MKDSQTSKAVASIGQLLEATRRRYLRAVVRLAAWRCLLAGVAAWVVVGLLDVVLGLPNLIRLSCNGLILVGLIAVLVEIHRRYLAGTDRDRMAARLIERHHPGLGNRLTNAVEFRHHLDNGGGHPASHDLMAREIVDAAGDSAAPQIRRSPVGPASRRESRLLCLLLAVVGLAGIVNFRLLTTVLPRLAMPWGDFPPYSPTMLTVSPGHAEVDYGDSLRVEVWVAGKPPHALTLMIAAANGKRESAVPLFETAEGTYEQVLEHVSEDLVYYAKIQGGRSLRHRIKVVMTPRIRTCQVRYDYPAYTRLRPATQLVGEAPLRAYAGTKATLTVTSNRPLAAGEILLGAARIPMLPRSGHPGVEGNFTVDGKSRFEVSVRDPAGNDCSRPLTGSIIPIPDRLPEAMIVSPAKDAFATPRARIPIDIEVRDDLGVNQVSIYRSHNGSRSFRQVIYQEDGISPTVSLREVFDLESLGVRPGDVIEYFCGAMDSNPSPPGIGTSRTFRLLIVSEEQYAAQLRSRMTARQLRAKYARLSREIQELAEQQRQIIAQTKQLAEPAEDERIAAAKRQRLLDELASAQARLAHATRALENRFRQEAASQPIYDIEEDYKRHLLEACPELVAAAQSMDSASSDLRGAASASPEGEGAPSAMASSQAAQREALAKLVGEQRQLAETAERSAREIDMLFALYRDVAEFKYLLARQEALAQKSRYFAGRSGIDMEAAALCRRLAEEQADVRLALGRLRAAFIDHARPVEELYPKVAADARAIAARIQELNLEETMDRAHDFFARRRGDEGHRAATEAYELMLSMVSMCQGAGEGAAGQCEARLKITMGMNLGNTFPQLAQGISFGSGQPAGGQGQAGDGTGGMDGAPFALFGDSPSDGELVDSEIAGLGKDDASGGGTPADRLHLATDSEELSLTTKSSLQISLPGGEQIVEEYRQAIAAYFLRLAREEN